MLQLYNFFARSRSRSKSKSKTPISNPPQLQHRPRSQSADLTSPILPTPSTSAHGRHASLDDHPQPHSLRNNPYIAPLNTSPHSKPFTRSQSRPLSTTTTATHSTITSLVTPTQGRMGRTKGKKFGSVRGGGEYDSYCEGDGRGHATTPSASGSSPIESPYPSPPISPPPTTALLDPSPHSTKQPTSTRLRLHNLFGIPLTSHSRRASLGARSNPGHTPANSTPANSNPNSNPGSGRGNTPEPGSVPASPPLPPQYAQSSTRYADLNSPPGRRPVSSLRRATSPSPGEDRQKERERDREEKREKEKRRSATAPASWLTPRFFSGSGSTIDRDRGGTGSPPPYPNLHTQTSTLTAINPDSTSTLHTQTTHTHASRSSTGHGHDRGMGSSIHAPRGSVDSAVPPVPKIVHTPPTPQKGTGQGGGEGQGHKRSMTSPRTSGYTIGNGGGRVNGHGRNRSLVKVGESFGAEEREREREEQEREREATEREERESRRGRWSPRFFGGGRDSSRDKGKERDIFSERRSKGRLSPIRVGSPIDGRTTPGSPNGSVVGLTPSSPRNARSKHGSFDFESFRPLSGGSSAAGGAMGSRVAIVAPPRKERERAAKDGKLERTVSFSDTHKASRRHHPHELTTTSPRTHPRALPIATPSSPTVTGPSAHKKASLSIGPGSVGVSSSWGRSTTATGTTANGSGKRKGFGLSHGSFPFEPAVSPSSAPPGSEFGVIRSDDSGYAESPNSLTTGLSASTNGISRRAGKGRSLDLNIGLSWAPTKVKQEAVMSSSYGASRRERKEREKEEEQMRFESGVSELFREVLGEGGFASFKKCEC